MSHLSNAPLVMIWRRVYDLPALRPKVERINGWEEVSADSYSVMYDAGAVLVGYWNQSDLLLAQTEISDDTCTKETQSSRTVAFNPSNQLILAVEDTSAVLTRLSHFAGQPLRPAMLSDDAGQTVSFVDEVGNITRFLKPSQSGARGLIGQRLTALAKGGLGPSGSFHPVVGYELLSSDLDASREFYQETLRLQVESVGDDELVIATGKLLLTIRREPTAGLVNMVRETGKLKDDLLVFHHPYVESAVEDLSREGIEFPNAIEDSPHGRLASFEDPDGHALSVWQPPRKNRDQTMNHFAVLDRLVAGPAGSVTA